LSAIRECLFSVFTATFNIWRPALSSDGRFKGEDFLIGARSVKYLTKVNVVSRESEDQKMKHFIVKKKWPILK